VGWLGSQTQDGLDQISPGLVFSSWGCRHCCFMWVIWLLRMRACLLSPFSCVQLFCDPMDCSSPGSSVCEILQAKILEWVAISPTQVSSQSLLYCRWILYCWATREAWLLRIGGRNYISVCGSINFAFHILRANSFALYNSLKHVFFVHPFTHLGRSILGTIFFFIDKTV